MVGLGEGVGERGAGVADGVGQRRRGRAGGRARRSRCRRRARAAPRETPPTEMSRSLSLGQAAGDEGVRQHHGAGAAGGAARSARTAPHRLGRAPRGGSGSAGPRRAGGRRARGRGCRRRRRGRARRRAAPGSATRPASVRRWTPAGVDQPGAEPEPARGVVVAAGDHDAGAGGGEPGEGLVGQRDGVDRGQRPVVDVAGDDHQVDLLGLDGLDQVVDERRLRGEEVLAVERPAQVPVGGVQDAHVPTLGEGTDRTAAHTPSADRAVARRGRPRRTPRSAPARVKPTRTQPGVLRRARAPARWAPRPRRGRRLPRRRPSAPARSRSGR